ncbi:S41 family peptidase [Flavobacterium sp. K5-23]|uniref:S41 family peptidase n=1 Tax=Flavobacterium sp. K5-23 TaxID=2746225 RepID=UPI00200C1FED|nr:S41 family peptidase [Flavobacterium sp. K5-23]
MNNLISVQNLKADVDFTYKKLQKLHPKLYWYISKEELDYKFDSLKTSITKPLTSFEFYKKLSPVVSAVKQGHISISPPTKKRTKKEKKAFIKKGTSPFTQFDFEIFNDKLYVVKNKSYDETVKIGSEVEAINNESIDDLFKEYEKEFSSDGYNKTFISKKLPDYFSGAYTLKNGFQDSLKYSFNYNDEQRLVSIIRKVVDTTKPKKEIKKKLTAFEKAKKKADDRDKNTFGYNPDTKTNNRNLRFIEKDNSIAVIKIRSFSNGNYRRFYEESFSKIDYNNSKTLIIDLRNNGGGRLAEIADLYSYLSDSTFVFLDKSEVASKTSMFKSNPLTGLPFLLKFTIPFYYPYIFFAVHKNKEGSYVYPTETKPHKIKKDAFKGNIYVLINGGSFSASSIISSNLKGSKRAFFVGEETGGAYNGTVAGRMTDIKLPKSAISMKIGLMLVAPFHKTVIDGHGVYPDKEITPTLEDRIKGIDPEMNWILNEINSNKSEISNTIEK